jgi:uncharacterized membrane protein YgaE (UPF0421/DUF939 family)
VLRCSGAATAAYLLAKTLGLPQAVWAAMSAVIVSQERLAETRASAGWRIAGTLLGICVTVVVGSLATRAGVPLELQIALAVAACALVVRRVPAVRVAMWTCPLILLSHPADPIASVALHRGAEVALGVAVGWTFHVLAFRAERRLAPYSRATTSVDGDRKTKARTQGWDERRSGNPHSQGD